MLNVPDVETLPLHSDSHGVIRVGQTRVTLSSVLTLFKQGATAEEIAQRFPTLVLADIYSVIGYYLRHQEAVDAYLTERQEQAEAIRQENDARFNLIGIRERLMARRSNQG